MVALPPLSVLFGRATVVPERFKPLRFFRAGVRGLRASATLAINQ